MSLWSGGTLAVLVLMAGAAAAAQGRIPLFDAHLHYSAEDAERLGPAAILDVLDRNGVDQAVVSGRAGGSLEALYREAPERILPFLSVYRDPAEKRDWMHDPTLPARVERWLDAGIYRGIGEIHIFAADRHSPVLRRIVEIAAERGLVLQVHGDAEVIDTVFGIAPQVRVLWAHMGTRPEPGPIRAVLARHPQGLCLDTSVRDERIAPGGRILPEWRALFTGHAERFVVGVDTHWVKRWERFDTVAARIRGWLPQLPRDVARRLAYGNAERLLGAGPQAGPAEGVPCGRGSAPPAGEPAE